MSSVFRVFFCFLSTFFLVFASFAQFGGMLTSKNKGQLCFAGKSDTFPNKIKVTPHK
jgi:hypothetical protein